MCDRASPDGGRGHSPPSYEQNIDGKTVRDLSKTSTVEVMALIVAPRSRTCSRNESARRCRAGHAHQKGTHAVSRERRCDRVLCRDLRRGDVVQFVAPR